MRTWRIAGIVAVLLFGAAGVLALYQGKTESEGAIVDWRGKPEVNIVLTDKSFQPNQVRITKGTTVVFTTTRHNQFWPASNPHPTHVLYPEFDPKVPIEASSSWSFVFDKVGTWGYHDHIRSYFTGTIYVGP